MLIFSSKGWVDANKASQSTIEELQGRLNFFFQNYTLFICTLSRFVRSHILNCSSITLALFFQFS